VSWDNGVTFPDPQGASMSLDPTPGTAASNDDGTNWCEGVTPYGAGDLGTPGAANPACGASAVLGVGDLVVGDLVITEILQNPTAVSDSVGEWFEVLNTSGSDVDLDGLEITSNATVPVVGTLVVPAGGSVVFGVNADPLLNGGVSVAFAYGSSITLANDADEVSIGAGGAVLDEVAWDNGVTFPDPSGASMSLDPGQTDPAANDTGGNWCTGASAFGAGDLATPGTANPPC
jgi:hypothetical protein